MSPFLAQLLMQVLGPLSPPFTVKPYIFPSLSLPKQPPSTLLVLPHSVTSSQTSSFVPALLVRGSRTNGPGPPGETSTRSRLFTKPRQWPSLHSFHVFWYAKPHLWYLESHSEGIPCYFSLGVLPRLGKTQLGEEGRKKIGFHHPTSRSFDFSRCIPGRLAS